MQRQEEETRRAEEEAAAQAAAEAHVSESEEETNWEDMDLDAVKLPGIKEEPSAAEVAKRAAADAAAEVRLHPQCNNSPDLCCAMLMSCLRMMTPLTACVKSASRRKVVSICVEFQCLRASWQVMQGPQLFSCCNQDDAGTKKPKFEEEADEEEASSETDDESESEEETSTDEDSDSSDEVT